MESQIFSIGDLHIGSVKQSKIFTNYLNQRTKVPNSATRRCDALCQFKLEPILGTNVTSRKDVEL